MVFWSNRGVPDWPVHFGLCSLTRSVDMATAKSDPVVLSDEERQHVLNSLVTQKAVVLRAMRAEKDAAIVVLRQVTADRLDAIAAKIRDGALF